MNPKNSAKKAPSKSNNKKCEKQECIDLRRKLDDKKQECIDLKKELDDVMDQNQFLVDQLERVMKQWVKKSILIH